MIISQTLTEYDCKTILVQCCEYVLLNYKRAFCLDAMKYAQKNIKSKTLCTMFCIVSPSCGTTIGVIKTGFA